MPAKINQSKFLNNRWLIAFLVLSFFLLATATLGMSFYRRYVADYNFQAAKLYVQMLSEEQHKKLENAKLYGEQIINDYPKTTYAGFVNLWLAKEAVGNQDYQNAKTALEWNLTHYLIPELKDISRIRLIRILLEENDLETAKKYLDAIPVNNQPAENYEIWGDYYVKKQDTEQAFAFYQKAQKI